MKTMTCKQLGGVCDKQFHAETFEEMSKLSQTHAHEMAQKGDVEHIAEMNKMMELMKTPDEMTKWMETKKQEFAALPKD